jgi:hypothetical protein
MFSTVSKFNVDVFFRASLKNLILFYVPFGSEFMKRTFFINRLDQHLSAIIWRDIRVVECEAIVARIRGRDRRLIFILVRNRFGQQVGLVAEVLL